MQNIWLEILGWSGMVIYLSGYFLVSIGILSGDNWKYHFINFFTSIMFCIYYMTLPVPAWPGFFLNAIFGLIALYAIFRISHRHVAKKVRMV